MNHNECTKSVEQPRDHALEALAANVRRAEADLAAANVVVGALYEAYNDASERARKAGEELRAVKRALLMHVAPNSESYGRFGL